MPGIPADPDIQSLCQIPQIFDLRSITPDLGICALSCAAHVFERQRKVGLLGIFAVGAQKSQRIGAHTIVVIILCHGCAGMDRSALCAKPNCQVHRSAGSGKKIRPLIRRFGIIIGQMHVPERKPCFLRSAVIVHSGFFPVLSQQCGRSKAVIQLCKTAFLRKSHRFSKRYSRTVRSPCMDFGCDAKSHRHRKNLLLHKPIDANS